MVHCSSPERQQCSAPVVPAGTGGGGGGGTAIMHSALQNTPMLCPACACACVRTPPATTTGASFSSPPDLNSSSSNADRRPGLACLQQQHACHYAPTTINLG